MTAIFTQPITFFERPDKKNLLFQHDKAIQELPFAAYRGFIASLSPAQRDALWEALKEKEGGK